MKPKRIMDTTDRTEAGPNQMKHGHRIDHRIIPLELLPRRRFLKLETIAKDFVVLYRLC